MRQFFPIMLVMIASAQYSAFADNYVCDAEGKCGLLMGNTRDSQPVLSDLLKDIIEIFNAPEMRWVQAMDQPPPAFTAALAQDLKSCYKKAITLEQFMLPDNLSRCIQKHSAPDPYIRTDKKIQWTSERNFLMKQYLLAHTGDSSTQLDNPTLVVTHWTGGGNLDAELNSFQALEIPKSRGIVAKGGNVNVSCHFVVGRDGTIFQMLDEDQIARHVIGLNRTAYCIENVGGPNQTPPLTQAQVDANARLIEYLKAKHPSIQGVIGHFQYRNFEGTSIFDEKNPVYRTEKEDPGPQFLSQLRKRLDEDGRCESH